ncbi:MAG: hypothetical protein HY799_06765 [Nitrosomonadales bacterium]|nr:hypothetical protein [Nitrosomonadales bacterium]
MFNKTFICLVGVGAVLASIPTECFAGMNEYVEARCAAMNATFNYNNGRCVCKPGFTESNNTCVPNGSSSDSGGSSSSGRDYEAERRAQEQADAARRVEEQRQAELERQRREAENKRRIEEAARQAKFLEDRDAAASTLRGSTGTRSTSSASGEMLLRGSTSTSGSTGLRGSSTDSGLRGLRTGTTVTPNTDPMVVDARNVPSGLPKSVDDAIPHTPSGERVRKGFQAVQAGDWKVALAWFQDAHNKEPGDPGIARLVDLAQFTLEYRTRAPTPTQSTQSPNQNSKRKSTADEEAKPGDTLARITASKMAAKARADAAFKKYVEKYGEHDAVGRSIAVSKAARGEGYSDAELKEQLQEALMDYRNNYRKNHPNGRDGSVGGSPRADEIVLGGKG